ncbi:ABC transporter, permease protein [Aeromicrobium marinum DSM 15272]|uniref:ABC transporter, permease protein n=1 Tax=Aeromicrobium marinum DSM 15272 TaxID=585531 RepID=E2SBZ2_9ACTN|nr:ABC transporter permease subunit [Aeromicrobium marinum]EFQ83278.1 ABC transporter, permease protein [Aeromicrobium marinum DSM 15272]
MDWVLDNRDYVTGLALDHLWLSLLPIVIGFAVAVPIGWVAHRRPRLRGLLLGGGSILYTIPSLPLFIILPSILGTGILDPFNVVVALSLYAIALMVRSAAEGFGSVSPAVLDAATASGYGPWRRAFTVELPLAGPVLLAGLRVVTVSTVSLVSVGALIGVSSLGSLFTSGFRRDFDTEILTGVVGIVLIALVLDGLLVLAGRVLMPWAESPRTAGAR